MTILGALIYSILAGSEAHVADYDQFRSAAINECGAIDPADYQNWLLFNPDGYRSFYVRSECFQRAAVLFRDASLCDQVRQRRSLFFSSWGYAPERCRTIVAEGLTADRAVLEEMRRPYTSDAIRLRTFRIERNGNGRDFNIVPAFSGHYAHTYLLTFEIIDTGTGTPITLHASRYYLDSQSRLDVYVRQADIRDRLPGFVPNRPYRVRASIVLDVGNGGPSGYWSDAFIERTFPVAERRQSIVSEASFQPYVSPSMRRAGRHRARPA
jgi:hypothetical protein